MAKIKITCDSASDLPKALSQRYKIDVLPLGVTLGTEKRMDRVDVDAGELYAYSRKTGKLPSISPIAPEVYRKFFQSYLEQGYQVLHVSLSGHISDCYRNACIAAEDLPDVSVVDSSSLSAGAGQLAVLAAELADADYLGPEIANALNEMKKHLNVSFLLQSSAFFKKSGKSRKFSPAGEMLLHLKPEFSVRNGIFHMEKPLRGDLESTILNYVRRCLEGKTNIQPDRVFVTYSQVPQSILDKVTELLQKLQPFEQVVTVPASSAVSCRCGPGSLGLSFMTV